MLARVHAHILAFIHSFIHSSHVPIACQILTILQSLKLIDNYLLQLIPESIYAAETSCYEPNNTLKSRFCNTFCPCVSRV